MRVVLLALSFFILFLNVQGNELPPEKRQRVGLSLSGGGAKGLAYIPLLKAIDSLGIKIDFITGTSIGGLVGGLYAIGYTGKDLEKVALDMNWDFVLSDDLPMNKINIEEKDEYGRYLYELNSNSIKPTLPLGLIQGQNIMRKLNDLTFRAHHIHDFNKFKIPFKCYAADIASGNVVVLDKGSLPLALRATMSIPTVFSPIDTGDMMLVDGGLLRNFPVEDVIAMGADFVIGGNTSGSLWEKKELKTLLRIMDQSLAINSAENYQKQKDLCDLLIDYTDELKIANLGSSDFDKTKELIALGERVLKPMIPILEQLAEEQRRYKINFTKTDSSGMNDTIPIDELRISVNETGFENIIHNKVEFADHCNVTLTEINTAVDRVYGTRFFNRVYYFFQHDSLGQNLVLKTEGSNRFAYKMGLHYDNELSAGIILNLTYRNISKFASRALLSFDLSDNPKLRAGYQVYLGNSGWWLSTNHFFSSVSQKKYVDQKALGFYNNFYYNSSVSINWTLGMNNVLSMGSGFEFFNLRPSIRAEERVLLPGISAQLHRNPYKNIHFFLKAERNVIDRPIFPRKGMNVKTSFKLVPWGNSSYTLITAEASQDSSANNTTKEEKVNSSFNPYLKWMLSYSQYIPVHKKMSLHFRGDLGLTFIADNDKEKDFSAPLIDAYHLGGVDFRERERQMQILPFWGNRESYTQSLNVVSAIVELQAEPISNIFIIPRFSMAIYDNGNTDFYGDLPFIHQFKKEDIEFAWSGGASVAYNSIIGPIKVNVAKASNSKQWLFFASLGIRF